MINQVELKRDCPAIAIPGGQRETLPAGTIVRIVQARGASYTISTQLHTMYRIDGAEADALGLEPPAQASAVPHGPLTEAMVWDALKTIYDPEIPVNVVDLGLIYACSITAREDGDKEVSVRMGLTAPGCGMSNVLKTDVESRLLRLPEVKEAHVEVVFDPPWNPGRMSEAARLQLGLDLDQSSTSQYVKIS